MPLTEQQRNALPALRSRFNKALFPSGIALSVEERARQPDPAHVPPDVTVHIDVALPSPHPHPLLLHRAPLRKPERVPIYFYALQGDQAEVAPADTRVIFFIHGGANVVGHPTDVPFFQFFVQLLRALASRCGDARRCVLVAPSYRLATVPENAFPAALQDVLAAYDYVLGKGYDASNIVIAGDSAGGNHAVVLTHLVLQSDRPAPRGVVAIAPAAISEDAKARASGDTVKPSMDEHLASVYVGDSGVAPSDPLVSGAFIPVSASWPQTLILAGTGDELIVGSLELERRLVDMKRPVELVKYDERPHAWWVLPQLFPEDVKDAAQRIARFVLDEHEPLVGG